MLFLNAEFIFEVLPEIPRTTKAERRPGNINVNRD
jgi:hypothetical protein